MEKNPNHNMPQPRNPYPMNPYPMNPLPNEYPYIHPLFIEGGPHLPYTENTSILLLQEWQTVSPFSRVTKSTPASVAHRKPNPGTTREHHSIPLLLFNDCHEVQAYTSK